MTLTRLGLEAGLCRRGCKPGFARQGCRRSASRPRMKGATAAMAIKTDRNDARAIAHAIRGA
jgi:transposase